MKPFPMQFLMPVAMMSMMAAGVSQAATVTITDAAGVATSCGNLTTLSQNSNGQISLVVSGSCLAQSGGSGGGDSGGAEDNPPPPPPPPPPSSGNDSCVSGGGIVCMEDIGSGRLKLPAFELTTLKLPAGEIHVYPFVYQSSFDKGKVGPAFGGKKEVKISTQPGDLSPTTDGCYQKQRNNLSTLKYENAANPISAWACDLHDGVQYYLNIRTTLRAGSVDEYRLRANPGF